MSKGFFIALLAMGGIFYFLHQSDPAGGAMKYGPGGGAGLVEVTPSNFQREVMDSPGPVLVYCWASW